MSQPAQSISTQELLAHASFVRGLARCLVMDENTAEDLAQQTWLTALEKPPRRGGPLHPWLAALMRNISRKVRRGERRRREREAAVSNSERVPSTATVLERESTIRAVVDAVMSLAEPYRSAILLRFYEGLPPRVIARQLGVPVNTLRSRITRALHQLRGTLDRESAGDRDRWRSGLTGPVGLGENSLMVPEAAAASSVLPGVALMSTKTLVVTASAVLLAGAAIAIWLQGSESDSSVQRIATGAPPTNVPATPVMSAERREVQPSAMAHFVRGRVIDRDGNPVPEAEVALVAEEDPFGDLDARGRTRINNDYGRNFGVDEDGRYEVTLPGARRVRVYLRDKPSYKPERSSPRWVETPADEIDFIVTRMPTGTLVIRAFELSTRRPLSDFRVVFSGQIGIATGRAKGEVLEREFRVPEAGARIVAKLTSQAASEGVSQEVFLRPVQRLEIELGIPSGPSIRGRIVDSAGNPIDGALVFCGTRMDGMDDEPFDPFLESRIVGVRTMPDGWFDLAGEGETITAWHPEFSAATTSRREASRIVLPPRGAIQGILTSADGSPQPGLEIVLDDVRKTLTDERGWFSFDRVEAGVRGLFLPGKRIVGVRVESGETAEVSLRAALGHVRVDLHAGGEPFVEDVRGILGGLDELFTCVEIRAGEGGFEVDGVLPGRYFVQTTGGSLATLEIEGPYAQADLGTADLTVHGPADKRIWIAPGDAEDYVQIAAKGVSRLTIPASGSLRIAPLPIGEYMVGIAGQATPAIVVVEGPGASLSIK